MKTKTFLFIICLFFIAVVNSFAQNTYVPDDNFEQALIDLGYDSGVLNDSVPTDSIKNIERLFISGRSIFNIEGIGDFTSLRKLYCYGNQIDRLDLTSNTNLTHLYCSRNLLKHLDLRANANLESLDCENNQLDSLNLSANTNLKYLICSSNFLSQLDLKYNTNLQTLDCFVNEISELDLSFNNQLIHVNCIRNNLISLNLKNGYNSILSELFAYENPNLLCIQVDNASEAYSNPYWLKNAFAVFSEDCSSCDIEMTYIPDNNFEQALIDLELDNVLNDSVPTIAVKNLTSLNVFSKNITDLSGIEDFAALEELYCYNNQISEINLSDNTNLKVLQVQNNSIYNLDLTSNVQLTLLDCSHNNLINLDLSANILLIDLYCYNNYLIDLDLSLNPFVGRINATHNQLTGLNLQNGNNYNMTIDIWQNTNLTCVQVDEPLFSENSYYWHEDEWTSYSEDCSFSGAGVPVSEYLALEMFYSLNNGEDWQWNTNWLDTITSKVGEWDGIGVEDGHVVRLSMDSSNVTEILPQELKNLTHLEKLYLFNNNISGNLPEWIGELSSLKELDLVKNNITGEIPASIGGLYNIETLWLSENQISGNIPVEIGNLTELRHLDLSNNILTGKIPKSIGNLTNLWTLDLSNNQLVGPLPIELENLINIYRFDIENNLIGNIDFNKSTTIENIRQIPDELAGLLQMDTLYLGGNKLQFNDIEAIFSWDNYDSFDQFIYAPQDSIGSSKTIETAEGDAIELTIDNYYPGFSDKYQWYKNEKLLSGETEANLMFANIQLTDAGKYYCKITNPVATELTLTSRKFTLNVLPLVNVLDFREDKIEIYPNPAEKYVFIETNYTPVNVEVFNNTGQKVLNIPDFQSGSIDIKSLNPGIYFFRITTFNNTILNKKIIIN